MKNPIIGETEIIGKWILSDGKILPDKNCDRIEWLVNQKFYKLVIKYEWEILYLDRVDGRYWDKVFFESELNSNDNSASPPIFGFEGDSFNLRTSICGFELNPNNLNTSGRPFLISDRQARFSIQLVRGSFAFIHSSAVFRTISGWSFEKSFRLLATALRT